MKGILFNTQMVRAIDAGIKHQTRRKMKLPPIPVELVGLKLGEVEEKLKEHLKNKYTLLITREGSLFNYAVGEPDYKTGDILYIRETYANIQEDADGPPKYIYRATHTGERPKRWISPRFMPKKAARRFIKITSVTPELLTEISESDARAEGIEPREGRTAVQDFKLLWESIHGKRSFRKDVAVWRYEFEIISKPKSL